MPKIEVFPPDEGEQDNDPPTSPLADLQTEQRLLQGRDSLRGLNGQESEPPERACSEIALIGSDSYRFHAVYGQNNVVIPSVLVPSHYRLDRPEERVQSSSSRDSTGLPRSAPGDGGRRRRGSTNAMEEMSLTVAARGGAFRCIQPEGASGGSMAEPRRREMPVRYCSARYDPHQPAPLSDAPAPSVAPLSFASVLQPLASGDQPQNNQHGSSRGRRKRLFHRTEAFHGDSGTKSLRYRRYRTI